MLGEVSQQELDRAAYALARDFLLEDGADKGVTSELVEKYLHLDKAARPQTLAGLYERALESAQNANMKAGVIGGAIGSVRNLGRVLCDFEPARVLEKYPSGWEDVLDDVVTQLKPRGSVRRTPRSIWPSYCRTVVSGARFLSRFSSADDFYGWVDFFDGDERARPALPLLLAQEIEGFGFALACDFLKELGYENFSKPDAHVKEIFWALGLSPFGTSDYDVFRAVARVARNAGVTPYNVDKRFWLIGSGYFYDDTHIGNNGRVGGRMERKARFVEQAGVRLKQLREGATPNGLLGKGKGGLMARATTCVLHGQEIDILHEALRLRDQAKQGRASYPDFRCVECDEPVRPHKQGGHMVAHFEHLSRNRNCRLSDVSW